MSATLSVIVPTVARDLDRLALLRRSLRSALHQLREGDELLCAGDTREGPLDDVRALCQRLDADSVPGVRVRYLPHDGGGRMSWGHDQVNHAMSQARGDYLAFNDDDDVFVAGAFDAMREEIAKLPNPTPLLFRFKSYHGPVFWLLEGLLGQGLIGGHCMVCPNLPSLVGTWGEHYEGDWTFIESTLRLWAGVGVGPVWVNRLIVIARPEDRGTL